MLILHKCLHGSLEKDGLFITEVSITMNFIYRRQTARSPPDKRKKINNVTVKTNKINNIGVDHVVTIE